MSGAKAPAIRPPILMLVTDRRLAGGQDALVAAVDAAVTGGVNAVQLREKDMPTGELLALARRLREVTGDRALLVVNGSPDVALKAGAEGVHLPEHAFGVQRPHHGFLIGRSVHTPEGAARAQAEGADYVIAGRVYETRSHAGARPAGLSLIRDVVRFARGPVIAIGGITPENAPAVMQAGAHGVAVISAVLGSRDPARAATALAGAMASAAVRP